MNTQNTKQTLLDLQSSLVNRIEAIDSDFTRRRSPDFSEQATEQENEEVQVQLKRDAQTELRAVNLALHKIEQGQYGECERCHNDIDEKRLAVLPYTQFCIHCA